MTSIYLTQQNEKRVDECVASGKFKGKSELVNRALDVFFMYMNDPHQNMLLIELEVWIQEHKYNTNMFNMNTNVPNMNTNITEQTPKQHEDIVKTTLQAELPMLKRILNNPVNNETVPDHTLKTLSKKYDIQKSTIQAWIVENKEWLKDAEFNEEQ